MTGSQPSTAVAGAARAHTSSINEEAAARASAPTAVASASVVKVARAKVGEA